MALSDVLELLARRSPQDWAQRLHRVHAGTEPRSSILELVASEPPAPSSLPATLLAGLGGRSVADWARAFRELAERERDERLPAFETLLSGAEPVVAGRDPAAVHDLLGEAARQPVERWVQWLRRVHETGGAPLDAHDIPGSSVAGGPANFVGDAGGTAGSGSDSERIYRSARTYFAEREHQLGQQATLARELIERLRAHERRGSDPTSASAPVLALRAAPGGAAVGSFLVENDQPDRVVVAFRPIELRSTSGTVWSAIAGFDPAEPVLEPGEVRRVDVRLEFGACPFGGGETATGRIDVLVGTRVEMSLDLVVTLVGSAVSSDDTERERAADAGEAPP